MTKPDPMTIALTALQDIANLDDGVHAAIAARALQDIEYAATTPRAVDQSDLFPDDVMMRELETRFNLMRFGAWIAIFTAIAAFWVWVLNQLT